MNAPFPWFGGKSRAAEIIWSRFGDVPNYVEPFAGSLAVLLVRPHKPKIETVNDYDCYLANFWRSLKSDPDTVATHADWPVNEADMTARHAYMVAIKSEFQARMFGDPDYYDAKLAGWWVWGISCWIGGGWCSGKGPWRSVEIDGIRQLVHLGDSGQGVNRKLVHLKVWMTELATRLARVRVCCGDWSRVLGPSPTVKLGITAVLLDPPYAVDDRSDCYAEESKTIAHDVRAWAIEHGDEPMLRIALCGYEGEHAMPPNWECVEWRPSGGYGSGKGARGDVNKLRERIWFSPHCLRKEQATLW